MSSKVTVSDTSVEIYKVSSGGSRIFPLKVGVTIILQIYCRKLHENERIWTPRGARPWCPLGSANGKTAYLENEHNAGLKLLRIFS